MNSKPIASASRGGKLSEVLRELALQERTAQARVARLVATQSEPPMAAWVAQATDLLHPLWQATREAVLGAKVLHVDTPGLPVLDASGPGSPMLGSFWRYAGDGKTAFYLYCPTDGRPGELGPEDVLSRRTGYVVADGSSLSRAAPLPRDLIACGCNLQAHRLFIKARQSGDARSTNAVNAFQRLYDVEEKLRACPPEERHARRQQLSSPIYDDLVDWCIKCRPLEPPSSPLGQALHYVLENEAALRRFLDDGVIPIDNAIFDRPHLRVALPHENHLLASDEGGAQRAAIACTLWSCCQLAEIEPIEYLADVLPRLSRGIPRTELQELLPAHWSAAS